MFQNFEDKFDSKAEAYLLHRFETKNDLFHWPQILVDSTLGCILFQDFSKNYDPRISAPRSSIFIKTGIALLFTLKEKIFMCIT